MGYLYKASLKPLCPCPGHSLPSDVLGRRQILRSPSGEVTQGQGMLHPLTSLPVPPLARLCIVIFGKQMHPAPFILTQQLL